MEKKDQEARLYEVMILARPNILTMKLQDLFKDIKETLSSKGGIIKNDQYCGAMETAYPIKKSNEAHYTMLTIECTVEARNELERKMKFWPEILRFLFFRQKSLNSQQRTFADYLTEGSNSNN